MIQFWKTSAFAVAALFLVSAASRADDTAGELLPTGQQITPAAATGARFENLNPQLAAYPDHLAGQAVTTAVSHDGKTLLVLTSGFNRMATPKGNPDSSASSEYVFVFDISGSAPKQMQVVQVPDTDSGLVFSPDDSRFFVSGGVDDNVHIYVRSAPSTASRSPSPALLFGPGTWVTGVRGHG